jgi:hypothetical protein
LKEKSERARNLLKAVSCGSEQQIRKRTIKQNNQTENDTCIQAREEERKCEARKINIKTKSRENEGRKRMNK